MQKQKNFSAFLAITTLVIAVFIGDMLLPLGMAVGFTYIIVLFAASRYLDPEKFKIITILSSFLIVLIVFLQEFSIYTLLNRILALLILWLIAYLLLKFRHIEDALKKSQARLSGIVSSAMDAIITVNSDQNIVVFNKAAEKLFGYTKEEALGKHLGILIPPEVKDAHKQYVKNFGETGTTNRHMGALGAVRGLKKNGEEFPIEASISQVSSSGEKLYSVILRDITERKLFEEKLNTSLKEKEVLLKEVHHRVKNNLQIMSSLLSLQSEYLQDERLAEMMIENQNRIKSMAMIHEKLYQTKALSKLDVHSYITELVNNLLRSYLHNNSQVSLSLDIEHIELDVDAGIKLGLIINELVSNSLKYAFPDGFKGEKTISIILKKDISTGKIKLVVSDTGIGMKESFDLEKAESLGLQLVDTFTEQLDGNFRFFNKNGTNIEIIF